MGGGVLPTGFEPAVDGFRTPMLCPLSYEGLRCTFAQDAEPLTASLGPLSSG